MFRYGGCSGGWFCSPQRKHHILPHRVDISSTYPDGYVSTWGTFFFKRGPVSLGFPTKTNKHPNKRTLNKTHIYPPVHVALEPDSGFPGCVLPNKTMCPVGSMATAGEIPQNWQHVPLFCMFQWLGPPVVPFYPFLGEGSPTKIDYRKKLVPLF